MGRGNPLPSGVAFAAIQGLNEMVQQKDAEIDALESRINSLERTMMMPWIALVLIVIGRLLYSNREAVLAKIYVRKNRK